MFPRSGYITERDQSMVGSGQKTQKSLPVFFFMNLHDFLNTNTKPQAKKTTIFKFIPEEKQLLVDEKDADNIEKVLCKVVLRIKLVLL